MCQNEVLDMVLDEYIFITGDDRMHFHFLRNIVIIHSLDFVVTVNQQILAAIKFGVSQNKVIWRLLNLASPRGPSLQCTIDVHVGGHKY